MKNLGEMQAASLARGAVSASAGASGAATGAETVGDPMEVDKDTGGVRHNKAENYLPKIPTLSHEKMGTRASEIANWAEFTESISSWLALLDDFYPVELYRATITDVQINQNSLEKGPAARSARFHNLLKQSLVGFQRGLDIVRQCEQLQLGASCGYESFRRLNLEFGIQSRLEATSIRESTLAFRPGKHVTRPLDVFRAVEAELLRSDRTLNSYPSVRLSEAEKIMLHFRCISEECKQYVLLHGKSDTLEQLLESIKVFDSHLRLISYEKESKHAKSFWNEDTLAAFNKGKGKKGKDSKGKGKKGEKGKDSKGKGKKKEKEGKGKGGDSKGAASKVKCFNCDEVGHFARDCPHPKKEKGAGASGQPKAKASPQPTITMMLVADTSGAPCFHQPLVSGEGSEVTNPFFGDLPSPGFTDSEEKDHHAQDDFGLREDVFHELRDFFRGFEQEVFLDWHDCRVCICHGVDLEDLEQHDHGCIVAEQHHEQHELGQVAAEQHREQHELGRFACMLGRSPPQEVVQLSSSFGCRQSRGESTLDPSLWDHLWLADSGASIHLIAESLLSTGHADLVDEDYHEVRCTLASGESLSLTRRVIVRARFLTASDSLVCCELTGMLVDNVHSLLSLGSLAAKGWTVTLSKQGFCVRRRQLKLFSYWGSNVGSAGASSWAEISMRQVPLSSDSDVEQQGQEADMTKTAAKDQKEGPAEAKPERPQGDGHAEDHRRGTGGGAAQTSSEAGGGRDADSGVGSAGRGARAVQWGDQRAHGDVECGYRGAAPKPSGRQPERGGLGGAASC